jgi:hypothetical protein
MKGLSGTELMGAAIFGFLAVVLIARVGVITVGHWVKTRQQEQETKKRFALLALLLEYPGEEGARIMATWREQEALARVRERRQWLRGGLVGLFSGVGLAAVLRVLSPGSDAWAIGFIPGLVGCAIAAVAYFTGGAGVESRA